MTKRAKPTAIDLFSGCGGLTTGLKLAGFRVLAAVECETGALEAYKANHPKVRLYREDIRQVKGPRILSDLGLARGALDLLAGCPPCQGFSRMRTLNRGEAVADPRNDLVREYLRLVEELHPKALLFENVPGLRNDPRYRDLLQAIRDLGFDAKDEIHNAADFGVPQRRRRLILLAARGVKVEMPQKLPSEGQPTVRSTISCLPRPGASGDLAHDVTEIRQSKTAELIRLVPRDGGSREDLGPDRVLDCHVKCKGFYDVYGRMRWDAVSPTITGGFVNPSKGRFLHPEQDRCVTPREAALLQSFPPQYKFPMEHGKHRVAVMIGNAFPPELARRHAVAVHEALSGKGKRITTSEP